VNPERWRKVREVLDAAIAVEPAERPALISKACAGDPALRAEVESLLASHESAGDFIEKPVYAVAPELLLDPAPDSLVGRRLGPYAVIEELGQGGMGVVYLAEDSRLGRRVALKALAPQFTLGEQHRERLRREARAAAALSNSGVATVYALEELDGILCIVSEYVQGDTLRTELSRGPLPPQLLLDTAIDLANTLAAAHEQGVIHRDLKPENVIRTGNGRVKILDFGLARFEKDEKDTETSGKRLTHAGTFLGTPAYASPEQLRGLDVDLRTDIFSLGVMLYELASGTHPFGGRDSISTIARILEKDPADLAELNSLSPPQLNPILCKCLSKAPKGRYASARDLALELERLRRGIVPTGPQPAPAAASAEISGSGALWWWQFHQVAAALAYYFLLYPLWRVRDWLGGISGSLIFFTALVAVGVAANLRLHLWFTSRYYPSELAGQLRKVALWQRGADFLFALLLTSAAAAIERIHAFWAALILGAAVACLISLLVMEPATRRAALGNNLKIDR